MQESFDPLKYNSKKEAIQARNKRYSELKKQGRKVTRFSLPGQLSKYSGLGQPDGRIRTVYYVNIWD